LEPIPRKPVRCRSRPRRRRGRLRERLRTRLGNARESRAPCRDCHGLNGRWRKSPRCLFGLPESRSSSGWPKEDTENSQLDDSSREARQAVAASYSAGRPAFKCAARQMPTSRPCREPCRSAAQLRGKSRILQTLWTVPHKQFTDGGQKHRVIKRWLTRLACSC
jgi:hypothetical protein